MPRGANQKFKLYRLMQIMLEKTDDEHYITMAEILEELEKYGVSAERKSIYNDLKDLEELGVEIEGEQRGQLYYYHVVGRQFELAELKLLVDSVHASKFITVKKSTELVKKLASMCSEHEGKKLQRQVFVRDRVKSMNESIYYSVDAIYNAIAENKKIRFKYFSWNEKKEMVLRHDGADYLVSPWMLILDDENYYLVGYDSMTDKIKHYRVDKMTQISMVDQMREGKNQFRETNRGDYTAVNFGMFSGDEEIVNIKLHNSMCGVFIDRFGKDITFMPIDSEYSSVHLKVALSSHFFGWIFALGEKVRIIGPDRVVSQVKEEVLRIMQQYDV